MEQEPEGKKVQQTNGKLGAVQELGVQSRDLMTGLSVPQTESNGSHGMDDEPLSEDDPPPQLQPTATASQLKRYFLRASGVRVLDTEALPDNPIVEMLVKAFDPNKADELFLDPTVPKQRLEVQQYGMFRPIIYRLADKYPECSWVKWCLKSMSAAGFNGEVDAVATAARQSETFMKMLRELISKKITVKDCTKLLQQREMVYVYGLVMMQELSLRTKLGLAMKAESRKIIKYARNTTSICVRYIVNAMACSSIYPELCETITSIISQRVLRDSDVMKLYKTYTSPSAPPVEYIEDPQIMDLLIDALFKDGVQLSLLPQIQCTYLLGYACSMTGDRDEVIKMIDQVRKICKKWHNQLEAECILDFEAICDAIMCPTLASCVLRWIEDLVAEPYGLSRCTPLFVVMQIVDAVSLNNVALHSRILHMLIRLYESLRVRGDSHIMKRIVYDRLVFLAKKCFYAPADMYIRKCKQHGDFSAAPCCTAIVLRGE